METRKRCVCSIKKNQLTSLKEFSKKGKLIKATRLSYQEDPNFPDELVTIKNIVTKNTLTGKKQAEENYYNQQKHGAFIFYNEKGTVILKETYRFGNMDKERIVYFKNGKVKSKEYYLAGRKVSTWFAYFENGKLAQTTTYKNNRKEGLEKNVL